jgi:hypothetical protein
MRIVKQLVLAVTMGLGLIASTQASIVPLLMVPLLADGHWNEFNVDDFSANSQGTEWIDTNDSNSPNFGMPLHFLFNIANGSTGTLTVVDAGFAGDRFEIYNNGQPIGSTSATNNSTNFSNFFSNNLYNTNFSSAIFTLNNGSYDITGTLLNTLQSFNATNGALKLEVSKATVLPEPSSVALLLAGMGLFFIARRRR